MAAHNLPQQPTSFIGRETEIQEIIELLVDPACQLLTLIGPGGIGKTRLALEVAEQLMANDYTNDFVDGVTFAALHPLASADNIPSAIASAVDFQFYGGGEPEEQLLNFFRKKQMLLLLDNFEHLMEGSEFVEAILSYAPGVQILITSREPLKMSREWRYEVRGMHYPEQDDTSLDQYDAVQLFVGRARQVKHDFSLDDARTGVLRVCQAVDGMPLALELTASWLSTLAPDEIADEIMHGVGILATDIRDVEVRHRSFRAVFDTTWMQLKDIERTVFMKLSVFRGGCTREAAEQVAGAEIRTLTALVDKCLVRVSPGGRYDLHELVRQCVAEKFDERPATKAATLDDHCDYYANLVQGERERIVMGNRSVSSMDMENLGLAWRLALDNDKAMVIQSMAEGLYHLYWGQGRSREGLEQFTYAAEVLAMPEPCGPLGVTFGLVRFYQGALLDNYGQNQPGQQLMLDGVALLRDLGAPKDLLAGVFACTIRHAAVTDIAEIGRYIDESTALAKACGEDWRIAYNFNALGWQARFHGDPESARVYFQEALKLYVMPGSMWGIGYVATMTGDLVTARQYLQEALRLYREVNNTFCIFLVLWGVGLAAFLQGDYDEAERLLQEGYTLAQDMGDLTLVSMCSSTMSVLAWQQGQPDRAKELAEECLAIKLPTGDPESIVGTFTILSFIATGTGNTDEAATCCIGALRAVHNHGVPFYEESIMRESLISVANLFSYTGQQRRAAELLGLVFSKGLVLWGGLERHPLYEQLQQELKAELGAEVYNTAWAHGQTLNLETTYNELLREFSPEKTIETLAPNEALVEPLTEREMEVLILLADGLSNREIAAELTVVVGTVKAHVYNSCQKLGANNRTQAVAKARALKLL